MYSSSPAQHGSLSEAGTKGVQRLYDFRNISFAYSSSPQTPVLQQVSLEIQSGDFLFITGSSGAGKTTLLHILGGQEKAHGELLQMPKKEVFLSRVFQDLKLFDSLTGLDNLLLYFDKKVYQSKKHYLGELDQIVKFLGMQDILRKKVKRLNGGAKQKLALVRALMSKPQVLLLDEPTCSLDSESSQKVYEIVKYFNEKFSTTVIWATHNRELVRKFNGRNLHLERGRIIYSGHACLI